MRQSERVYDELLVLHAQAGDPRAFERLAARWQPRLLRSARRFTGHDEVAHEAVQESWIGIVSRIGQLREPARFPGWAFAILRRRCAERVRAQAESRARWSPLADAREPSSSPRGEDRMMIVQAFARLPEAQRVAATLFFVEQLKIDEIAAATGAPVGTVKSRIFAARNSLKMALEGRDHDSVR
jgi:RNA polymerase sigma factor (sigma-70 family)